MEMNNAPQEIPVVQPSIDNQPIHKNILNQKVSFITALGVIFIILIVGVVGYYLFATKSKTQILKQETIVPSQMPSELSPTQTSKSNLIDEEGIIYEDNGFSLRYPRSLEMHQTYKDAVQWKSISTQTKEVMDALTLHESSNPFPAIATKGKYTIWSKGYPDARSEVIVDSVKEDAVSLGQNQTTLFTFECGNDCLYAVARFTSNKKYYELIYNLSSGDISRFKEILANLSFFDPNAKEWKTYTSKEGDYSIQYPPNATFLEKVYTSVDGVRGYSSNRTVIIAQKASPREGSFSVHLKK